MKSDNLAENTEMKANARKMRASFAGKYKLSWRASSSLIFAKALKSCSISVIERMVMSILISALYKHNRVSAHKPPKITHHGRRIAGKQWRRLSKLFLRLGNRRMPPLVLKYGAHMMVNRIVIIYRCGKYLWPCELSCASKGGMSLNISLLALKIALCPNSGANKWPVRYRAAWRAGVLVGV